MNVPHKEGAFIVESSTYGSGTTLATLADMNDMIFEGMIDEAEVGKIREGMDLLLDVGATLRADADDLRAWDHRDDAPCRFA